MPKFSIIIPVYNTSRFLPKCFDSILSQSFKDYEVIIINDGSTDNSLKIIEKYCKRYSDIFSFITIKNQGPSIARNMGIKKAKGDYLIFVDSDDYIEKNLLKKIDAVTQNEIDLVRFQLKTINSNYKLIERFHEEEFKELTGPEAFEKITNYHYIETAWAYAYNRKFFTKNKFKFMSGIYHEDFALIPLIIIKAESVVSIDYIGYNYVQRNDSIMSSNDYVKTVKKVYDFLKGFDYLYEEVNKLEIDEKYKKIFISFIANSTILKARELNKEDLKDYTIELKNRKMYDLILDNTLARKLKKSIIKLDLNLYFKIFNRR